MHQIYVSLGKYQDALHIHEELQGGPFPDQLDFWVTVKSAIENGITFESKDLDAFVDIIQWIRRNT